jgi:hypothetical protein
VAPGRLKGCRHLPAAVHGHCGLRWGLHFGGMRVRGGATYLQEWSAHVAAGVHAKPQCTLCCSVSHKLGPAQMLPFASASLASLLDKPEKSLLALVAQRCGQPRVQHSLP